MLTLYILQQFATIILTVIMALTGIYLIVRIYTAKKKTDITTLRARVFLDESFLKDSLAMLLVICLFFIINTAIEINEILELFTEGSTGLSESL